MCFCPLALYCTAIQSLFWYIWIRVGFRTAATSKMERFVIIVIGWKPLTSITKRSILHVAAVLDPPLWTYITVHLGSVIWKSKSLYERYEHLYVSLFLECTVLSNNINYALKLIKLSTIPSSIGNILCFWSLFSHNPTLHRLKQQKNSI